MPDTHVLIVVTSHDRIDERTPTGLWLDEFLHPYRAFVSQGYRVTVASPRGGMAPIDPRSAPETAEERERVADALAPLTATERLADVDPVNVDALFITGGHGTMFDLAQDERLRRLIETLWAEGKPIAAVCHGVSALVEARGPDGAPLVEGFRLTAFTDDEEREVGLAGAVPFLLESRLRELGSDFVAGEPWSDHVEEHDLLITGQNPQSSASAARSFVHAIQGRKTAGTFMRA